MFLFHKLPNGKEVHHMKGKVLPYHNNEKSAIDWPNAQNHFGCGDQEPNQVIQPTLKKIAVKTPASMQHL